MNENFEADFEGIVIGRGFGIDRVFCLYGVSSMTEKDTELWNKFERYVQEQERDISELAVVLRANWGFPKSMSMSIAREVYMAGWRKEKDGNGKKTV